MKKVGFPQFSLILLMMPSKLIAMNTLNSFLDPTVYVLCRKICEYKSYTGMKNRSERKFPCWVQSKIHFFAILLWKLAYYQENQPALVIKYMKNSYKKCWATLWCQNANVNVLIELLGSRVIWWMLKSRAKRSITRTHFKLIRQPCTRIFSRFKVSF